MVGEIADTDVVVEVDLDDDRGVATIIDIWERTIDDLFNENGGLRLWEDDSGWTGFIREETDDGNVRYFHVNTFHDKDVWLRRVGR